jgi:hypothetical protein
MEETNTTSWEDKEYYFLEMWKIESNLEYIIAEMIVALEDPRIQELKNLIDKYNTLLEIYNYYHFIVEGENVNKDDLKLSGFENVSKMKQMIVMIE